MGALLPGGVKAVFNKFPSFTKSNERPKMSISLRAQSSTNDQKLCSSVVRCFP